MAFFQRSMPAASGASMFWKACSAVAIAGLADAVEDAAGLRLLAWLHKQRKAYSRATWVSAGSSRMASRNWSRARSFSPIFEVGVGEILADGGAFGSGGDGGEEAGDGGVVAERAQRIICAGQRGISRIRSLPASSPHQGQDEHDAHRRPYSPPRRGKFSQPRVRRQRIGENARGRRIELLMFDTISASLKPGWARSLCHSGSAPKSRQSLSREARSSNASM